jgi:hypothetical protein
MILSITTFSIMAEHFVMLSVTYMLGVNMLSVVAHGITSSYILWFSVKKP